MACKAKSFSQLDLGLKFSLKYYQKLANLVADIKLDLKTDTYHFYMRYKFFRAKSFLKLKNAILYKFLNKLLRLNGVIISSSFLNKL